MAAEPNPAPTRDGQQLTQRRVSLDEAEQVFAERDASGSIPIVVVTERPGRIRTGIVGLGVVLLAAGVAAGLLREERTFIALGVAAALVCAVIGIVPSFIVRIPEGTSGLLTKRGRYLRTISSGIYYLPPWLPLTHLVTRREIPFDVPVVEAMTRDDFRASVDILVTFMIVDPYRFVYNISATDFDQVFQARCQDSFRLIIRRLTAEQVIDLAKKDVSDLQEALNVDVAAYGVEVRSVSITFAQPQTEFVESREARQLAVVQQAEQAEKHTLALQRQSDDDSLIRSRVLAEVMREKDLLQIQVQRAQAQQEIEELQAAAESLRLARLEERLQSFPRAVEFGLAMARLEIARSLAGNTRAIVQMGNAGDSGNALVISDIIRSGVGDTAPLQTPEA